MNEAEAMQAIRAHLTPDLLKPGHQGHCYVACEALALLLGPSWMPCFIRHEESPHWFLRHRKTGAVLDPTADQFATPVPYHRGRGKGFLTREPSRRARTLLARCTAKEHSMTGRTVTVEIDFHTHGYITQSLIEDVRLSRDMGDLAHQMVQDKLQQWVNGTTWPEGLSWNDVLDAGIELPSVEIPADRKT